MQGTHKSNNNKILSMLEEEKIIALFKKQPLIILIRISQDELDECKLSTTLNLLLRLVKEGVKNVEIGWCSHFNWEKLAKKIIIRVKEINFGVASITTHRALNQINQIGFKYAMSPFYDESMLIKAKKIGQLLIPGVMSPSEIHKAIEFKCKLLKVFPAKTIGINYLNQLKTSFHSLPFLLAAGGLKPNDLDPWLKSGYNAIILGRGVLKNDIIDPELISWLQK